MGGKKKKYIEMFGSFMEPFSYFSCFELQNRDTSWRSPDATEQRNDPRTSHYTGGSQRSTYGLLILQPD